MIGLISKLPTPLRELAIKRAKESRDIKGTVFRTDSIWGAISWTNTPEGILFWERVYYNRYDDLEKKHLKNL